MQKWKKQQAEKWRAEREERKSLWMRRKEKRKKEREGKHNRSNWFFWFFSLFCFFFWTAYRVTSSKWCHCCKSTPASAHTGTNVNRLSKELQRKVRMKFLCQENKSEQQAKGKNSMKKKNNNRGSKKTNKKPHKVNSHSPCSLRPSSIPIFLPIFSSPPLLTDTDSHTHILNERSTEHDS